jgi:hypothetical protein
MRRYALRLELAEQEQKTVPIRFDRPAPVKRVENHAVETQDHTPVLPSKPQPAWTGDAAHSGTETGATSPPLAPVFTWIGVGLTVALGAGAAVSAIDSINGVPEFKSASGVLADCRQIRMSCADEAAHATRLLEAGNARDDRTTALLVGTAVAAAGTLVVALFLTDWSSEPQTRGVAGLRVEPRTDGASFVLSAHF